MGDHRAERLGPARARLPGEIESVVLAFSKRVRGVEYESLRNRVYTAAEKHLEMARPRLDVEREKLRIAEVSVHEARIRDDVHDANAELHGVLHGVEPIDVCVIGQRLGERRILLSTGRHGDNAANEQRQSIHRYSHTRKGDGTY